ncbi:MAG: hypothetical protein GKR94_29100 [Gammaproteobacteria bacterium]|nr:hypothetical protein [Gammaproteobacteria bacterium]
MKIFRERAGVIRHDAVWVCMMQGRRAAVDSSLARLMNTLESNARPTKPAQLDLLTNN